MKWDRTVTRLAWFLGVVFTFLGIAEVVRVVVWGGGGLAFWFLSLCGGGALILIGTFAVSQRPRLSLTLVAASCLSAGNATMWTLILPVLAVTLLVLTLLRGREVTTSASA